MSVRFDSQEHVDLFLATGRFPLIHEPLFRLVAEELVGRNVVDLCCSTGLLGERIKRKLKVSVWGIEADEAAYAAGVAAGVAIPALLVKVSPATMRGVLDFMAHNAVTAIVARRCIPELFGDDHAAGAQFAADVAALGVREVFLEGRVRTRNAVNTLATVEAEAALFLDHYDIARKAGECLYLKAK